MKRPKRSENPHGEAGESDHPEGGEGSCGGDSSCGGGTASCGGFPANMPESARFQSPSPTMQQQERISSGDLSDESAENPVRNGPPAQRWTEGSADVGAPVKNLRD